MPFGSGGASFNGGTITRPLVIATTDGNEVPLTIRASYIAQNVSFLDIVNTDNTIPFVTVDSSAHLAVADQATGAQQGLFGDSDVLGNGALTVDVPTGQIGFFTHAVAAQPTGVPVTAAGIHAALVSLGLITA